jgi:hypothetical protein
MDIENWFNMCALRDDPANPSAAGSDGAPFLLVIDDFLNAEFLRSLVPLFANSANWHDSYGLFRPQGSEGSHKASSDEWLAAPPEQRFWFHRVPLGKQIRNAFTTADASFVILRGRALVHPVLLRALEARTGMELRSPAVQTRAIIAGRGHFQAPHNDDVSDRLLCGALYLSGGWQPGFGGEFDMMTGNKVVHTVSPKLNRLVLFNPRERNAGLQSKHRVRPVLDAAGDWERWSISIWWATSKGN